MARFKNPLECGHLLKSTGEGLGAGMMTNVNQQIDAIFGLGAGIAEMLLQSHQASLSSFLRCRWTGLTAISGECAPGAVLRYRLPGTGESFGPEKSKPYRRSLLCEGKRAGRSKRSRRKRQGAGRHG